MSVTKASDQIERPPGGRKLIAVLHADVVGYSRLIGIDDVGTLQRLRALRIALIDPAIAEHGGRVANTAGDSLLVVFDSVDGAVRCAMRVQQQVPACDGDQPTDGAIRFRVGINVGDVIPDGTDIHGDVVNVAARLQAECPPSGICVSRAVRDNVHDRLDLAFEKLGALSLKNIVRPVEAFVLRLDTETASTSVAEPIGPGKHEGMSLPDKPSLAVLAFTNMSGDPEQEYFSDGVAEDIITELSRSRSLFVIARNSSFTYRGHAVDVKQVGHELGVRYVVEGGVRRSGSRVRVTAQLIEAETANHIWAERYDRDIEEVFAVQDEITAAISNAIIPVISGFEQQRALRRRPENIGAWEAYQCGLWYMSKCTSSDNVRAQEFFDRAIALDAAFSSAHAAFAQSIMMQGVAYGNLPVDEATRIAIDRARDAVDIDPNDGDAQAILSFALWTSGDFEQASERATVALASNPNRQPQTA